MAHLEILYRDEGVQGRESKTLGVIKGELRPRLHRRLSYNWYACLVDMWTRC